MDMSTVEPEIQKVAAQIYGTKNLTSIENAIRAIVWEAMTLAKHEERKRSAEELGRLRKENLDLNISMFVGKSIASSAMGQVLFFELRTGAWERV
jgi:uncharacterized protein Veg